MSSLLSGHIFLGGVARTRFEGTRIGTLPSNLDNNAGAYIRNHFWLKVISGSSVLLAEHFSNGFTVFLCLYFPRGNMVASAAAISLFGFNVRGSASTVVSTMAEHFMKGDVVEVHTSFGGSPCSSALVVVEEPGLNGFTGYLVSAAEEAFRVELFAIGPPITFEFARNYEDLPNFRSVVPLIAAEVLGNVRYKVAVRLPWAKGKQLTEINAKIGVIKGNVFPKMVTTPPALWYGSGSGSCSVVGGWLVSCGGLRGLVAAGFGFGVGVSSFVLSRFT